MAFTAAIDRVLKPGPPYLFPDPRNSDEDGRVAFGGGLEPERMLTAYRLGIFPWFSQGYPPIWWSPDPRAVLPLKGLHISKRTRQLLRNSEWNFTRNRDFLGSVQRCAERKDDGTWITDKMIQSYQLLNEQGRAHSFEVWQNDELAEALFGVAVGGLFVAESMVTLISGGSKAAMLAATWACRTAGFSVFDVQLQNDHLASMGVIEISREEYLTQIAELTEDEPQFPAQFPSVAAMLESIA